MSHFITDDNIQGYMFYSESKIPLNKLRNKESVIIFYMPFNFGRESDIYWDMSVVGSLDQAVIDKYTLIRSLLNSFNISVDVTYALHMLQFSSKFQKTTI